jgi:thiol:disulfide interchange protein DsbD
MATTESFLAVITRSFAIFCLILGIVLTGWAVLQLLPGQPSASMVEDTHSSLNWVKDHDQALAQAKQLGKPVFMDFYADWCIPCREMDKIFANAEVQKELERFVIAKLDCTQSTNSAAIIKRDKYNAPYMPFLLFFDRQGNRLREQEFHGYTDLQTFLAALRSIK